MLLLDIGVFKDLEDKQPRYSWGEEKNLLRGILSLIGLWDLVFFGSNVPYLIKFTKLSMLLITVPCSISTITFATELIVVTSILPLLLQSEIHTRILFLEVEVVFRCWCNPDGLF